VPGDPQQLQMTGLEEQWDFDEEVFIQGRPGRYDPGLQDPWALRARKVTDTYRILIFEGYI